MTLIDDLKAWYEDEKYPPDGPDLDQYFDGDNWQPKGTKTEQVSYEVLDSAARWGNTIQVVYKRDDELVAVVDIEPATEMQDWGDYGEPEIYPVEAYEVTVTKYRRVT